MKLFFLCCSLFIGCIDDGLYLTTGFVVKGQVLNEKKSPLRNASVQVKGTNTSTLTDNNGAFSLEVPGKNARLIVSYSGYETTEVTVKDQTEIIVSLKPANNELKDVAIVGYGVKLKDRLPAPYHNPHPPMRPHLFIPTKCTGGGPTATEQRRQNKA